jgi:hypothetical protein
MSADIQNGPTSAREQVADVATLWRRDWLLGRSGVLATLIGLWILGAILGMVALWRFESTAGAAPANPATWPVTASIRPQPSRATMVLFAHPKCPCTRASLENISALAREFATTTDAHVVFLQPTREGHDWSNTELCATATRDPHLNVTFDSDGVEAQRFGVATSGHVLLYDANGALLFSGGVTSGRGQSGRSPHVDTLVESLRGGQHARVAVFGCPLRPLAWPVGQESEPCPLP